MKKIAGASIVALLFFGEAGFAQKTEAPDPYKPILERLNSLQTVQLPEWRYHADMPHPEGPAVNDADWPVVKPPEEWKTGPRGRPRTIESPAKINCYAVRAQPMQLNW